MADDEDVLEQARAAGLTLATGVSRLGDTFIRAAQQRADTEARDKQLQVADAQRRYQAQARVADQLYRRAASPEWMRRVDKVEALGVWKAAQLWADLDQQRFRAAADQLNSHDPQRSAPPVNGRPAVRSAVPQRGRAQPVRSERDRSRWVHGCSRTVSGQS